VLADVWTVDQRFVVAGVEVLIGVKTEPAGSETRLLMLRPAGEEL